MVIAALHPHAQNAFHLLFVCLFYQSVLGKWLIWGVCTSEQVQSCDPHLQLSAALSITYEIINSYIHQSVTKTFSD